MAVKQRQSRSEERRQKRLKNRGEDALLKEHRENNRREWKERADRMREDSQEKFIAQKMQSLRKLEADIAKREEVLRDCLDEGLNILGGHFPQLIQDQVQAALTSEDEMERRQNRQFLITLYTRMAPETNGGQSRRDQFMQAGLKAIQDGRAEFVERTVRIRPEEEKKPEVKVYDPLSTTDSDGDEA